MAVFLLLFILLYPVCSQDGPPKKVVECVKVSLQPIQQSIRLIGTIRAKRWALFTAKTSGIFSPVLPAGSFVKKGELVAFLENEPVARAYELSVIAEKIAADQYERYRTLLSKTQSAKRQEVDEKQAALIQAQYARALAEAKVQDTQFKAPFDGIMGVYKARAGQDVAQGRMVGAFYDPSALVVEFDIPDHALPFLKNGQAVYVEGQRLTIPLIQKAIDPETHMSPARVDYTPLKEAIIETSIPVTLVLQEKDQVLAVPSEAVFLKDSKPFVYVVKEGKAILTPVTPGIIDKNTTEITDGLRSGDLIVAKNVGRLYPDVDVIVHEEKAP